MSRNKITSCRCPSCYFYTSAVCVRVCVCSMLSFFMLCVCITMFLSPFPFIHTHTHDPPCHVNSSPPPLSSTTTTTTKHSELLFFLLQPLINHHHPFTQEVANQAAKAGCDARAALTRYSSRDGPQTDSDTLSEPERATALKFARLMQVWHYVKKLFRNTCFYTYLYCPEDLRDASFLLALFVTPS